MPNPVVIPAHHLNALGMEGSDPPVRFTDAKGRQWSWHPCDCDCNEGDVLDLGDQFGERLEDGTGVRLLVEESMPALLRALARQYGMRLGPGEVPSWSPDSSQNAWHLHCQTGKMHTFATPRYMLGERDNVELLPAFAEPMGRLDSLAAAIAWRVSQ